MKKQMAGKTAALLVFLFLISISAVFLGLWKVESTGIAYFAVNTIIFFITIALALYYFMKYKSLVNISCDISEKFALWEIKQSAELYHMAGYFKIAENIKKMNTLIEDFQRDLSKGEKISDTDLNGALKTVASRYNAVIQKKDEAQERLLEYNEELKKEIEGLAEAIKALPQTKRINIRCRNNDLSLIEEKFNEMYRLTGRYLSELETYSQNMMSSGKILLYKEEYPVELKNIYNNFNQFNDENNKLIKEINEAILRISRGENDLGLEGFYTGNYSSIKNNLEKLSKDYRELNEKKSETEKSSKQISLSEPKNNDEDRLAARRRLGAEYLGSTIPKTPKVTENLDHIFESNDYGKYSR